MLFNMCQKAESLEYLYFHMPAFFVHPLLGFDKQSLSYFVIGSAFLLFSSKLCPPPPPPPPPPRNLFSFDKECRWCPSFLIDSAKKKKEKKKDNFHACNLTLLACMCVHFYFIFYFFLTAFHSKHDLFQIWVSVCSLFGHCISMVIVGTSKLAPSHLHAVLSSRSAFLF